MRTRIIISLSVLMALFLAVDAHSVELKKNTNEAFEKYVRLTEQRLDAEKSGPAFLSIDKLPADQLRATREKLANGEVVIEHLDTFDNGNRIDIPDGLVHHWRGIVFIPGATLAQTLALVQDYNRHSTVYSPDVARSKLMRRQGDDFHIFYRLRRRKFITVVMDTEYDVHYEPLGSGRMVSKSISSRIQEIDNPGEPSEKAKPVGNDNGFMWRLNSYWHMEERDGGVYMQCEAVSLSRDIPAGLGWMVKPFVQSVPKESLMFTLGRTREALLKK